MQRKPTPHGPRLEALLDERDHLRIQISLADNGGAVEPQILAQARQRLSELEREIREQWCSPNA